MPSMLPPPVTGAVRSEQVQNGALTKEKFDPSAFYDYLTEIDNTDSPYAVLAADETILVDTTTAAVEVNLPALGSVTDGRRIVIKDAGINAGTNNITVNPTGFEQVDGALSVDLISDGAVLTLVKTSAQWIRLDSDGVVNFITSPPPDGIVLRDIPDGVYFTREWAQFQLPEPEIGPSDTDDMPLNFP